ncbi:hypothetical protein C8J57DRAFT_1520325 [Mycena rebaudengoi]|nr:hypothetical protein C8J57DRAFT_1520325 [Mycena rebaudengoi]
MHEPLQCVQISCCFWGLETAQAGAVLSLFASAYAPRVCVPLRSRLRARFVPCSSDRPPPLRGHGGVRKLPPGRMRVLISGPRHRCAWLRARGTHPFGGYVPLSALLFDTPILTQRIVRSAALCRTISTSRPSFLPTTPPFSLVLTLTNRRAAMSAGYGTDRHYAPSSLLKLPPSPTLPHLDHLASSTALLQMASSGARGSAGGAGERAQLQYSL